MPLKETPPLTGGPAGLPERVSEPRFRWRPLWAGESKDTELRVARTLSTHYGLDIEPAGARNQSYDLRIKLGSNVFAQAVGLKTGNYEVKSLWRRNPNCVFDRRFKVGQRGERIYGMRDSRIKSFAMALDSEIDSIVENSVQYPLGVRRPDEIRLFFEEIVEFIRQAAERRHSKAFEARLMRLARACLVIPTVTAAARSVLNSSVQPLDIANGFRDVEGIFITAGPIYTMVALDEFPGFLSFDSASSEGPKVRYTQSIPSENEKKKRERNGI